MNNPSIGNNITGSHSAVISSLFSRAFGVRPDSIAPLQMQGSNRRYYRLSAQNISAIATISDNIQENKAFLYLSRHLASKGLNVPRILAVSDDCKAYIQQDLGSLSLFDAISNGRSNGRFDSAEISLLSKTIRALPDIQFLGGRSLDPSKCYPPRQFDRRGIFWDLNYFKYCYLKPAQIPFDEPRLEDDFNTLADMLLDNGNASSTLLYRDFQSRNVMILDNEPWFIDFQGAHPGPIYYDVASFLWQARAKIPAQLRSQLIDDYIDSARKHTPINPAAFRHNLRPFVLFRQLQTMGAYGFRGLIEKKPHFLKSINDAWSAISSHLSENPQLCDTIPYLSSLLKEIADSTQSPLAITVGSFSYKKGYPTDESGNGGGFVFDCRGMFNPGRHEQFRHLTGRDLPVIQFLEERGEVQPFVDTALSLISPTISNYIDRRFTNLSIWFGCTGGQHRSVYCADRLAQRLRTLFPSVSINLIHREQPQLS